MNENDSNTIRVLLVDDEAALLRSLSRVLADHDLDVETASCAAEAAAYLNHFPVDVVVCDQNMPGKSGLEFLADVSREKPKVITMMLSGQISGLVIAEDWAKEIGVHQVFAKPCDGSLIATAIKSAVREARIESAIDQQIAN